MRSDEELKEQLLPECFICKAEITGEKYLERSIVPLEQEVRGCTEYTQVYIVCPECKEKGELV